MVVGVVVGAVVVGAVDVGAVVVGAVDVGPVVVETVVVGTVVVELEIAGAVVVGAVVVAPTVGGTVLGGGADTGVVEVGATDVDRVVVAETAGALVVCGAFVADTVGGPTITRPFTDTGAGGALKVVDGAVELVTACRCVAAIASRSPSLPRAAAAAVPAKSSAATGATTFAQFGQQSITLRDTVPRRGRGNDRHHRGQLEAPRDAVGSDRPALRQVFRRVPLAVARTPPAGVGRAATRHIAFLRIDARQVDAGEATTEGTAGFRR